MQYTLGATGETQDRQPRQKQTKKTGQADYFPHCFEKKLHKQHPISAATSDFIENHCGMMKIRTRN